MLKATVRQMETGLPASKSQHSKQRGIQQANSNEFTKRNQIPTGKHSIQKEPTTHPGKQRVNDDADRHGWLARFDSNPVQRNRKNPVTNESAQQSFETTVSVFSMKNTHHMGELFSIT